MSAKSMANLYLNGKRAAAAGTTKPASPLSTTQPRFKSSTSNLGTLSPNPSSQGAGSGPTQTQTSQLRANLNQNRVRGKSTSMTNLLVGEQEGLLSQKTASRNALDNIHNGMNAKYAQVQSKVYQNIRAQSKPVPAASSGASGKDSPSQRKPAPVQPPRSIVPRPVGAARSVQAKMKALEEQLERLEEERELARLELERERAEKQEQVAQLKLELQEKIGEHERSSEEYHQKLLEAYELADGNRRATDSLLSESRQRDEENRKKVEELERQLGELREFVVIKEEMSSKMVELRDQLREERERYEQQLKSVSQLFENEKIRRSTVDENSNYFNRLKPALESNESINETFTNKSTTCNRCQCSAAAPQKMASSQQDIYGSRISARALQDGAQRVWKASKHFASSVITDGIGLSSCRQCGSVGGKRNRKLNKNKPQPEQHDEHQAAAAASLQHQATSAGSVGRLEPSHTSVIEVGSMSQSGEQLSSGSLGASSLIRVDSNNKLTIVTKFGQDQTPGAPSLDRSHDESSSGRGSGASEACSSAAGSQHGGDEDSRLKCTSSTEATTERAAENSPKSPISLAEAVEPATQELPVKRHKRRSSLFKASKLLGSSQTSLAKLRTFFTGSSGSHSISAANSSTKEDRKRQEAVMGGCQADLQQQQHLESSRLRCLELSREPSVLVASSSSSAAASGSSSSADAASSSNHKSQLDDAASSAGQQQREQMERGQQQQQQQVITASA